MQTTRTARSCTPFCLTLVSNVLGVLVFHLLVHFEHLPHESLDDFSVSRLRCPASQSAKYCLPRAEMTNWLASSISPGNRGRGMPSSGTRTVADVEATTSSCFSPPSSSLAGFWTTKVICGDLPNGNVPLRVAVLSSFLWPFWTLTVTLKCSNGRSRW